MIITTNIRLPEEDWKALKIMAVHAGTSVSALLRQAVAQLLSSKSPGETEVGLNGKVCDPFFEVIGIGAGGPSDDSTHHDVYLYSKK